MGEIVIKEVIYTCLWETIRNPTELQYAEIVKNRNNLLIGKKVKICGTIQDVTKTNINIYCHKVKGTTLTLYNEQQYVHAVYLTFNIGTNLLSNEQLRSLNKFELIELYGDIANIEISINDRGARSLTISVNTNSIKKIEVDWLTNDVVGLSSPIYLSQEQKDQIKEEKAEELRNYQRQKRTGYEGMFLSILSIIFGFVLLNKWYDFITYSAIIFGTIFLIIFSMMAFSKPSN